MSEKSLQVPLMSNIYENLSEVFVWLGEGSRYKSKVVKGLEEVWEMNSLYHYGEPVDIGSKLGWAKAASVLGFFLRSWFQRVWILQEFSF